MGGPTGDPWIPAQRVSDVEFVSMAWRHHVKLLQTCVAQSYPTPSFSNKAKTFVSGLHFTAEKYVYFAFTTYKPRGGGGGGGGLRVCKIMKRKLSYNVTAHIISLMVTRYSMCVLRKLFIDNFENWILHFVGFVNTPYMPIITIPCKHNHNKHIINRSKRHFDAIIMYLLRCEFDGL